VALEREREDQHTAVAGGTVVSFRCHGIDDCRGVLCFTSRVEGRCSWHLTLLSGRWLPLP
jgi:hypothetical protein